MIKKRHLLILLLLIISFCTFITNAQVVYEPIHKDIYTFLNRMSLKHIIQTDDEALPFSRAYIASLLVIVEKNSNSLNPVERDELEFHKSEYFYELGQIDDNRPPVKERWYLFSYSDSLFNLKLSPIAGYGISTTGNKNGHTRWFGAMSYASYSDWFGASIDIRDKGEFGDNVDKNKSFSPERGAWYKAAPNGIEYSDVKGSINFNWNWGSVSLIKDYISWGHGSFGNLILSDKSPSYPFIKLQLKPVDWFRFNYIHGWLNSLVFDSSKFYLTHINSIEPELSKSYINKYIAANMFTFTPWQYIDVSFGNSIVYSGDLRPEFFIPFLFFKFLDHNTGRGNVNDGNGQMYIDISVKLPETYHFYSTLFVDVTEIRNILENNFANTWIGFTLGSKKVDLIVPNLDISLEYTRINPWVYEHRVETTTYKHIDYYLGHWLGQNADQIRAQFDYSFMRGLNLSLYFERVRKGGLEDIYYAYAGMDEKDLPFLYEPLREDFRIGLNINYELIHDLNFFASYIFSDITDNQGELRTPEFMLGKKHSFTITAFFNL